MDPSPRPSCIWGNHMTTSHNQDPPNRLPSCTPLPTKVPWTPFQRTLTAWHKIGTLTRVLSWLSKRVPLLWTSEGPPPPSIKPEYNLHRSTAKHGPKCMQSTLRWAQSRSLHRGRLILFPWHSWSRRGRRLEVL